jgi:anti-sigma regulatory factor (Ser/Thr protein kinase)
MTRQLSRGGDGDQDVLAVRPSHAAATTVPAQDPPHPGFRHEAAVYRGERGFLEVTADYVREGLTAGERVLVAVVPPKIELLRAAIGPSADTVRFVDIAEVGRNPAQIIPMWREFVEAGDGAPVRGIGEPVRDGQRPAETAEALLHEALLNLAFADGPDLLLRCPYDAAALGETKVSDAHRCHPTVVEAGVRQRCHGYGGVADAAARFAELLPGAVAGADWGPEVMEFDEIATVRAIRTVVGERAVELGIDHGRASDLMLALHEIAVNSLRHGGGRGTVRTWADEVAFVCEVSDEGHIRDPLIGRIRPLPTQLSGRGMWLANHLCDLVQIRSSAAGTTVRMHMTF